MINLKELVASDNLATLKKLSDFVQIIMHIFATSFPHSLYMSYYCHIVCSIVYCLFAFIMFSHATCEWLRLCS